MTTDERFERIEHITAGLAEERKRDREEYKALWRDLTSKTESIARNVDALAVETRLRFEQVADQIAETDRRLGARIDQLGGRMDQLGGRIDQLVSAIGQMLRERP